jgi:hypothetical protein
MAKPTKKPNQPQTDTAPLPAAMLAVSPAATRAWLDVMSESTRFAMDRLQQDLETQQALLNCKTPGELMQLQSAFLQTAIQQYSDEVLRMFKMLTGAAEKTAADIKTSHSRGYDDIPL